MSSFLPSFEETLAELLAYGDQGALALRGQGAPIVFHVQGGVLVGIEGPAPVAGEEAEAWAVRSLVAALSAVGAEVDFLPDAAPAAFDFYDARRLLPAAVARVRELPELLERLRPVLEGWPELRVEPEAFTDNPVVSAWLGGFDGLAPGSARLARAPSSEAALSLAVLWVAWKLGDLDVRATGLIDDAEESMEGPAAEPDPDEPTEPPPPEEPTENSVTSRSAPSVQRAPRPVDSYHTGLALARAGQPSRALPLLEQAWLDDPDRPGLEEWLGYCRFVVCRESEPERARAGLELLREGMYRTGPSGELALLPWTLMARAQLERGDLVQARSILNSVLERDRTDPEAQNLAHRLEHAEAQAEAARQKAGPAISWSRAAALVAGVAVLALLVHIALMDPPLGWEREDLAPAYVSVLPLRELHRVTGGYVGVTAPGSAADANAELALQGCQRLAQALSMPETETLTLLADAGFVLAECGERLR